MGKHGGTPFGHDKDVTLAAISPPSVAQGRFDGRHQSGLGGCKSPPLFTRGASSSSSRRQRQRERWGASPRLCAPTYLPPCPVCPECPETCHVHTVQRRGKAVPKLDEHLEPALWHIQAIGELRQRHGSDAFQNTSNRLDLPVSSPVGHNFLFSLLEITFLLHDPLLIGNTAVKIGFIHQFCQIRPPEQPNGDGLVPAGFVHHFNVVPA